LDRDLARLTTRAPMKLIMNKKMTILSSPAKLPNTVSFTVS